MDQSTENLEHILDLGLKYECLGHNCRFKEDCYACKIDGFNKNCSSYKYWRTIVAFYVVPEDVEDNKNL